MNKRKTVLYVSRPSRNVIDLRITAIITCFNIHVYISSFFDSKERQGPLPRHVFFRPFLFRGIIASSYILMSD